MLWSKFLQTDSLPGGIQTRLLHELQGFFCFSFHLGNGISIPVLVFRHVGSTNTTAAARMLFAFGFCISAKISFIANF